jgi:hypothetical protein
MYALKPISHASVTGALAKAERYRLLNEPNQAESICRDILALEPENQQAWISLILALTDQIPHDASAFSAALSTAARLDSAYGRAYFAGIAWERRAKASYESNGQGRRDHVYEWIVKALGHFEEAEGLRAPGNDEALLRWNTCVRFLERHKDLAPSEAEVPEPILSE